MEEESKLKIEEYFTRGIKDVYKSIPWDKSDVEITDEDRKVLFTQKDCEFPKYFSALARKVVASKYFYGDQDKIERESSFRQLVGRISETIADWGLKDNYFDGNGRDVFEQELAKLMFDQRAAFNSPVQFNVGTERYPSRKTEDDRDEYAFIDGKIQKILIEQLHKYPQTSACFIQSVKDNMKSILMLSVYEGMLFTHGSGTGTDLSPLRSSREKISGGGKPSGPIQYDCFYDQIARIVKSGGKTRRAAKMNSLKDYHPDIKEFIQVKSIQQKKIQNLINIGYDPDFATDDAMFQNVNLSVRASDEFMRAVENDEEWRTIAIHSHELDNAKNPDGSWTIPRYKARELMDLIAEGTRVCGDPGMQFDTTINKWHTCPNSGRINASNPCSEYNFIDDSSCNLASLNLRGFVDENGRFNHSDFEKATEYIAIGQDLLYDNSGFPRREIAENSHKFRPLGQGFGNLGGLLMSWGIPYDSDEGRAVASTIAALQTASVYKASVEMAKKLGPFEEFEKNKESMLNVIKMHRDYARKINKNLLPKGLGLEEALESTLNNYDYDVTEGGEDGFRNAQATVLAPTGTIGFMMDFDTTGIEPDTALVKYKLLAGGGRLKIVNQAVPFALKKLGYDETKIKSILDYIDKNETIEGSELKEEHLPVFDCAFKPKNGKRRISPMGHIKMMAAVQPFLSGAISKTVNMDEGTSVEEIKQTYIDAWKMGLKAVAIYRYGSKPRQPLSVSKDGRGSGLEKKILSAQPIRKKLPNTRPSITHKFNVAGHEGYLTVGLYKDGSPGELFITMSKEGSTVGGLMDTIGTLTSFALQWGVPLKTLANKMRNNRFEPYGIVLEGDDDKDIKTVVSLTDYIYTWMAKQFNCEDSSNPMAYDAPTEKKDKKANNKTSSLVKDTPTENEEEDLFAGKKPDGGFCMQCGRQMYKIGHCEERCANKECRHIDYNGCGK